MFAVVVILPPTLLCLRELVFAVSRKQRVGKENQLHGWIPGEKYMFFGVLYDQIT